ncbi:hypothetical protein FQA39_LY16158 [Lamprigera yunnana]|nr:hypothetical protein FQA39_LY16158 [Lamprigera yunnana]
MENAKETDTTAIRQVYLTCDADNKDSVKVSKLLEFMKVPDADDRFNIAELQKDLDPEGEDPTITCAEFIKAVLEWAHFNCIVNLDTIGAEKHEVMEMPTLELTLGNYQERINELEYQKKQLKEELNYIKVQLASAEEQQEILHIQNTRVNQQLQKLQRVNTQHEITVDSEDQDHELNLYYQKEIHKMKKLLRCAENKVVDLKEFIKISEEENKRLQDRITVNENHKEGDMHLIIKLEDELEIKESKIISLLESNAKLESKISEHQQHITHHTECKNILTNRIRTLEQTIDDYENRLSVLKTSMLHTHNTPSPKTPVSAIIQKFLKFNTPKLLNSLSNPVSPDLKSPILENNPNLSNTVFSKSPHYDFRNLFNTPEEDDCTSTTAVQNNNNINDSLILQLDTSSCNSLYEEMLFADQEYHKNDCPQAIRKQKMQIEELEDTIDSLNNSIEKFKEEVEHNKTEISSLKRRVEEEETKSQKLSEENQQLVCTISEEIKTKDLLHSEIISLRECNTYKKLGNFGKMELRLEKREAQIEKLHNLLRNEKKLFQKLKEANEKISNENCTIKTELEIILASVSEHKQQISKMLKIRCDVSVLKKNIYKIREEFVYLCDYFKNMRENVHSVLLNLLNIIKSDSKSDEVPNGALDLINESELDQFSQQLTAEQLSCSEPISYSMYLQIVDAFKNDVSTIDSRFENEGKLYTMVQKEVLEEFSKLDLMLSALNFHDHRSELTKCMEQLEILKKLCSNAYNRALKYGIVLHENYQVKFVNLIIYNAKNHSKKKVGKISKWKNCALCSVMCMFIIFAVLFRIFISKELFYTLNFEKSYSYSPPPT